MTALYRKYRPQGFDEVVGQEAVVRTLQNAIEHDQVRQAYFFAGPRATGNTSMAHHLLLVQHMGHVPGSLPVTEETKELLRAGEPASGADGAASHRPSRRSRGRHPPGRRPRGFRSRSLSSR